MNLNFSLDQNSRNRQQVLAAIFANSGISRTAIAEQAGLSIAAVSRITQEFLNSGLIRETDSFGPANKPGRRFVGLAARGEGGYIVGIGINAFRQSVTLADLENRKIAEWVSPTLPDSDGEGFLRLCLLKAKELAQEHVPNMQRFFGVGIAIAADIDSVKGKILAAPIFGWEKAFSVRDMAAEILDRPLELDATSSAINKAEGYSGVGKGINNLLTIYCSLGFGVGMRQVDVKNTNGIEFGRVLNLAKAPGGEGLSYSEVCGGISILRSLLGPQTFAELQAPDLSRKLVELIDQSASDNKIGQLLEENGRLAAQYFAILIEMFCPEKLILAGPLSKSSHYVRGFLDFLPKSISRPSLMPEICCSQMTPAAASRWLALRGNILRTNLDLDGLKLELAG